MSKQEIDNTQDVMDSRDIIERLEELQAERADLVSEATDDTSVVLDEARDALAEWDEGNAAELSALEALASEASGSPDWIHGETLIRESYFTDYIEELIDGCYELPKELTSGEWPYRHITVDHEAAANEAKQDYLEVDFDGVTYLIRA